MLETSQRWAATNLQPMRNCLPTGSGFGLRDWSPLPPALPRKWEGGREDLASSVAHRRCWAHSGRVHCLWLALEERRRGRTSQWPHSLGRSNARPFCKGASQNSWSCLASCIYNGRTIVLKHTINLYPTSWAGSCWGRGKKPTCSCVIGRMRERSESNGHGEEVAMGAELGVCLAGWKWTLTK